MRYPLTLFIPLFWGFPAYWTVTSINDAWGWPYALGATAFWGVAMTVGTFGMLILMGGNADGETPT